MQVHESHENMMQERATGAITLRPTGNAQGAYLFMSPATCLRINQQSFTPLPLPQDVINGVQLLACRNTQGLDIQEIYRRLFLRNEDGARYDPYDSTYVPSDG